jgi:hypothetical protein
MQQAIRAATQHPNSTPENQGPGRPRPRPGRVRNSRAICPGARRESRCSARGGGKRKRVPCHASPRLPPGACHLAPARLAAPPRPRPATRERCLSSLPPAPISEPARHLSPRAPRLRVSARPPHPAIKAPPAPTLGADAAAAAAAASPPPPSTIAFFFSSAGGGMAGISKRRTSPVSSSSSSGDGMPRRITRKPRSARRGPRGAVRRPPATRPVSASEFTVSSCCAGIYASSSCARRFWAVVLLWAGGPEGEETVNPGRNSDFS